MAQFRAIRGLTPARAIHRPRVVGWIARGVAGEMGIDTIPHRLAESPRILLSFFHEAAKS